MIPGSANPLLLASAAEAAGYNIERSLRFNSADSAYLSRTPASEGNRRTWTYSAWVKRSSLGTFESIFNCIASDGSHYTQFIFPTSNKFILYDSLCSGGVAFSTTQVFRDTSAWFHFLLYYNTTQSTASAKAKLYINGVEVTQFDADNRSGLTADSSINRTAQHVISGTLPYAGGEVAGYINGYLADVHFIDGQALDPTSFGYTDANGVWQPKAYSGGYGTNGFHLPFSDNSTTAALGTDTSGNSNTWTVNNISVAAGSGNDSLVDTPTSYGVDAGNGGEVRGNYCTLNPLDKGNGITLSNGNLDVDQSSGTDAVACGTIGVASGKWYWEVQCTSGGYSMVGIADFSVFPTSSRKYTGSGLYYYQGTGGKYGQIGGSFSNAAYGAIYTTSDIIGVALDMDNGNVNFYKNGVNQGVANTITLLGKTITAAVNNGGPAVTNVINFGQRPFAYTAPSGYKALCTTNLPSTTITTSGSYTGNGVADGPFVYLNGVPTAMTVNGNAVTFGTEADKLSNGFKVRTASTTYNQNAATYNYSITSTGDPFKRARAQSNP